MTIEQYLNEYLERGENVPGTSIQIFEKNVQGKGAVTVEYSPETDKADIIHTTQNNRNDFYEASNAKELKGVVEYCLGPIVSDRDWYAVTAPGENFSIGFDDEDYINNY